jgi:hypothetical protein
MVGWGKESFRPYTWATERYPFIHTAKMEQKKQQFSHKAFNISQLQTQKNRENYSGNSRQGQQSIYK